MPESISEDLISEIKARINIVDVVSDFVSLKKGGANYKGLCPFHSEKTPSFTVNEEKQIFHCFGCGTGGNVITFLMKAKGMTFPETVRDLAKRAGVLIPKYDGSSIRKDDKKELLYRINDAASSFYHGLLIESAKGKAYLKKRGLEGEIIKDYRLGYGGEGWDSLLRFLSKNNLSLPVAEEAGLIIPKKSSGYYDRFRERVIFPIFDLHDRVVGFGGRSTDGSEPKYLNSPESAIFKKSDSLYGLTAAKRWIRDADEVLIVEGYIDLLSLHQAGIRNAVATLGTALTSGHLRLLKRLTRNIVTVFDADEAGIKATLRAMELFLDEGVRVRVLSMPKGHDPDTFVREVGAEKFKKKISSAKPIMEFFIDEAVRGKDIKEIGRKLKVIDEVLPYIERLPTGIERLHYLKVLSEKVDVNEDILISETKKRWSSTAGRSDIRLQKGDVQGKGNFKVVFAGSELQWRAEKGIIQLVVRHPELRDIVKESGVLSDFQDERLRSFGEKLLALPMDTDILDNLESEDDKGIYSRFLVEMHEGVDPAKELEDCIRNLRLQRTKRERERLRKEMEDAVQKGNESLLMELRERHRQLK